MTPVVTPHPENADAKDTMEALHTQAAAVDVDQDAAQNGAALAPRADCIADSAGGLTFDVTDPGDAGAAHLMLRHRETGEEVCLPLTPTGDGRLRAALPSGVELPEGRWNAFALVEGGAPRRLVPGVNDLRSLVDRAPSGARGHVAVRIPYTTKQGNLSVRSWLRAPHAEVGELEIGEDCLTAHGRVYGTALTGAATAQAVRRQDPGTVREAQVTTSGVEFTVRVPYGPLAEGGTGPWDLWLRPAGEEGPRVRLARLLDDIADKKPIFTYPVRGVEAPYGPVEAGPYYTIDNDLAVRIRATGPAGQ